jgi:hypothetical protein
VSRRRRRRRRALASLVTSLGYKDIAACMHIDSLWPFIFIVHLMEIDIEDNKHELVVMMAKEPLPAPPIPATKSLTPSKSSLGSRIRTLLSSPKLRVAFLIVFMVFISIDLLRGWLAKDPEIIEQSTKSFINVLYSLVTGGGVSGPNPSIPWKPKTGALMDKVETMPWQPQKDSREYIMMQVIRDRLAALNRYNAAPSYISYQSTLDK